MNPGQAHHFPQRTVYYRMLALEGLYLIEPFIKTYKGLETLESICSIPSCASQHILSVLGYVTLLSVL